MNKFLTFVSVPQTSSDYFLTEDLFKSRYHGCKIVFVSLSELKKEVYFRILGTMIPGTTGRTMEQLKEVAGFPQFNYGQFYDLKFLLYAEDVIEYGHHGRTFDSIRNAWQIKEEL